ncbi:MAG: hypothetical protein HY961_20585 [Ignavibacteriae bacterium]|nr:hypothetical protein [Ignavibacteriota bacterium]
MLIKHPTHTPQDGLLARYCSEAEEKIRSATNATEARQLGNELCSQFQKECDSELLFNATRQYINDIITRTFGR